jgi:hypothetical protein
MSAHPLPTGVGDREVQQRFIAAHQAFLQEFPEVLSLADKIFKLTLGRYNEPSEKDNTELRLAQIIVFYLARTAFDDFGDMLLLAGNGRGIGARKLLRGMYEHLVTAGFIAQNPAEAKLFNDHAAIEKGKIWHRLVELDPNLKTESTPEELQGIEERFTKAQTQVKSETCKKCGQPITQEAWTRVSVDAMASKVDAENGTDLAKLYASYYLMPTFHSHPTAYGLESRLIKTDGGWAFKQLTEHEAQDTVLRGHILVLRLFKILNRYFQLGLNSEIAARRNGFLNAWGFQDEVSSV